MSNGLGSNIHLGLPTRPVKLKLGACSSRLSLGKKESGIDIRKERSCFRSIYEDKQQNEGLDIL
jgi:hypothetical protein